MTDLMRSKRFPVSKTSKLVTAETAATSIVTVDWEKKVSNPTSHEPGRFRVAFPTSIAATSWVSSATPEYHGTGSPKQAAAKRANVLRCTVAQLHEWEPMFKVERIQGADLQADQIIEDDPYEDDSVFAADEEDDTDIDPLDDLELEEELEDFDEDDNDVEEAV